MSRRRFRREPIAVSRRLHRWQNAPTADSPLAAVRAAWPKAVGHDAARQTTVVRCSRAGVVTVACSSAVWAQELDMRRDRILMTLTDALPEAGLAGVRFVIGDHVMPAETGPSGPTAVAPTARERAQADAETPQISNSALRELLVRARAAQIALLRQQKSLQRAQKPGRRSRRA